MSLPRRFAVMAFGLLAGATLLAAAPPEPRVTRVLIQKDAHTMKLYAGDKEVGSYKVAIGPGGAGHKHREGDKVTPVGRYHVVNRGPSIYTVFMRLDYPNAEDRKRFYALKAKGALPASATIGGDIGIHGSPPQPVYKETHKEWDWTLGCIAVDDDEIKAIAKRVPDGTVVDIED
ncbi:MAG: L,D-transpeptidase family protein [Myxococcales bacterium]|nr:L,D-transpeptidase family protein [Myxococcales bacterium]